MIGGIRNREQQDVESALRLLALTERNQKLAEQYLDLSLPEDTKLLGEAEHQNFAKLARTTRFDLYNFLQDCKRTEKELAARYIRLVAEIGGETSQGILVYYPSCFYLKEFDYIGQFLSPVQKALLLANAAAWQEEEFLPGYLRLLIDMGMEDPEVFCQMREMCYNDEGANTQMLLTALYLHCVLPSAAPAEKSGRRTGKPEQICQMVSFLEQCLIQRIGGLFDEDHTPEETELKVLQNFVLSAPIQEPVPAEVQTILSGRRRQNARRAFQVNTANRKQDYQLSFLSILAFMAVDHSDRFLSFIRLAEEIDSMTDQNLPLSSCLAAGQDWFDKHILVLETYLSIPKERYIRWAIARNQKKILERMAANAPLVICGMFRSCSAQELGYLLSCIRSGNPQFYAGKKTFLVSKYRVEAAKQIVAEYRTSQKEAERYLLGELEISDILPCVESWRKMYIGQRYELIYSCMDSAVQVYRRAFVLECLRLNVRFFYDYWIDASLDQTEHTTSQKHTDVRQVRGILAILDEENVPPQYQIEFLGSAYEHTDSAKQDWLKAIAVYHKDWHDEWSAASQSRILPVRFLAIRVMGVQWQEYHGELLACASEKTKQGREFLRAAFIAHPDCEMHILEMLRSPRGAERELAVEVLNGWGAAQYREALSIALESEKTKKIRTLIQQILPADNQDGEKQQTAEPELDKLIQEILTGPWKRKLSWLPLDTFPPVHQKDGKLAAEESVAAVLVSYVDMKVLGINKEAQRVAANLSPAETAAYIRAVYNFWISDGAQAKRKWVLYAAAIHGDEAVVAEIYAQIQKWAQHSRGAMAAEAVKALALSRVPTALLLVDQISRRRCKYRPVKLAAQQALDDAAEQFEISREELEDRIIPDLGFDRQMKRMFDYGRRQFSVVLTPSYDLEVYDAKGKKLKNMPAPGKTDDPALSKAANDAWKLLKKQLNAVITNQELRLENVLSTGRQWEISQWESVFVQNPVMRQFAIGLIWGIYQGQTLTKTFRYMEDGTFNTVDEEEYILPQEGRIGLVHALELCEEELNEWKTQLADYEIHQPIEQLERPIYRVTEEEKGETALTRFNKMVVNALTLAEKLQNMGWYRGEAGDYGIVDTYYRTDTDWSVKLDFSGDDIISIDMDVVIHGVSFYKIDSKDSSQSAVIRLGEIPPRYFSETVLQVAKAVAAAAETAT